MCLCGKRLSAGCPPPPGLPRAIPATLLPYAALTRAHISSSIPSSGTSCSLGCRKSGHIFAVSRFLTLFCQGINPEEGELFHGPIPGARWPELSNSRCVFSA